MYFCEETFEVNVKFHSAIEDCITKHKLDRDSVIWATVEAIYADGKTLDTHNHLDKVALIRQYSLAGLAQVMEESGINENENDLFELEDNKCYTCFEYFLRNTGSFERFVRALISQEASPPTSLDDVRTCINRLHEGVDGGQYAVYSAFDWKKTPDGNSYWNKVNSQWKELLNGNWCLSTQANQGAK